MSLYGLLVFCAVYFVAVATPGPGVAAVIARSLAHGARGAPAFILGFLVGDLVWFTLAATGLAALAKAAYPVFVAIKYAGAAYLLYLAYRLWTAPATEVTTPDSNSGQGGIQLFLAGLALTLANPKAIIFFLALLPTVIGLDTLTLLGFFEIALAITIVLPAVLAAYVIAASRARRLFKSARAVRNINRATGATLAGAAVAVAVR